MSGLAFKRKERVEKEWNAMRFPGLPADDLFDVDREVGRLGTVIRARHAGAPEFVGGYSAPAWTRSADLQACR